MNRNTPEKEQEAAELVSSVTSKPLQNLLNMAIGQARLELIRGVDQEQQEWERGLPVAPFDMEFFVRVLIKAFRSEETVRQILDGKSIGEVTGWD